MNSVILIGRLTKTPELRYTTNQNIPVCTFALAVDKGLSKDKKQEMESKGQPTADFPNVVCFGKTAQNVATYLEKGLLVAVRGRIQTRTYDDAQGQKRYITEVLADQVEFIQWKDRDAQQGGYQGHNDFGADNYDNYESDFSGFEPRHDDNIPF